MTKFAPVLFSIANIMPDGEDEFLQKVVDALTKVSTATESSFTFDFGAVAFANKHPVAGQGLLLEVQALTEEARVKGIAIVTDAVAEFDSIFLNWQDVTEQALAYHAGLQTAQ